MRLEENAIDDCLRSLRDLILAVSRGDRLVQGSFSRDSSLREERHDVVM